MSVSNDEKELSIEEYKQLWVKCEEQKLEPKTLLKHIGKEQRPATKAIRTFMEENSIASLECGSGWVLTYEDVERVVFSEDVCSPYMDAVELARMKREQTKRSASFKTRPPPKRKCPDAEE